MTKTEEQIIHDIEWRVPTSCSRGHHAYPPKTFDLPGGRLALCSLPRTNPGNRLQYKRVNGPNRASVGACRSWHGFPKGFPWTPCPARLRNLRHMYNMQGSRRVGV